MEKKKNTAKIVDSSSVNYTFKNNNPIFLQPKDGQNDELNQKKPHKHTKRSIKDVKNQNRHKVNSKKIKTLQGHSPVYE
jgi:hypothetical protein